MKIAIAGVGYRAANVLSYMKEASPDVEFVGYYDPKPSYLERLGGAIPRFLDINEMLKITKPDLFFVGSPNHKHLEHIKLGLEEGVRVFSEKPVVTTVEDTMELAKLVAKHGSDRILVGLVLRYSQHMVDLRNLISKLGPIASIEANENIAPYHGAFFMRDWRRKQHNSGGFMLEKCCHDLDIINMIVGSRPTRVASFGGRRSFLPQHAPQTVEEKQIMSKKEAVWGSTSDAFDSDADIVDYQNTIIDYEAGPSVSFSTNLNVPDEHRRFCVMGALGMAEGDFVRGYLRLTARDGSSLGEFDYSAGAESGMSDHYGADQLMVSDVLSYLQNDRNALPVSVVDALEAGLVALAADKSRTSGSIVDMTSIWSAFDAALNRQKEQLSAIAGTSALS